MLRHRRRDEQEESCAGLLSIALVGEMPVA